MVVLGTPKVMPLIQKDFHRVLNFSGIGAISYEPISNAKSWDNFTSAIWDYQYTKNGVTCTQDIQEALYELSCGAPCLAIDLYRLVQIDAILSQKEMFKVDDFRWVAKIRYPFLDSTIAALRRGRKSLSRFEGVSLAVNPDVGDACDMTPTDSCCTVCLILAGF